LENLVNNIRVVLFDFIGTTVIETQPDVIEHCFKHAFAKNGISVSKVFIQTNRGRNKRDVVRDALASNSDQIEVDKVLFDFETAVDRQISSFQATPDAEMIFRTLQQKNIHLAIATGLSRDIFDKIINQVGWDFKWFSYHATYEEIGKGRPYPDLIIDLMHTLDIFNPQEILKVGDTVADIQEGKNAGTRTAAVLAGTQPEETLKQHKPDYLFKNLQEILNLVR
jgi:phosphonatase-like hydrolase